MKTFSIAICLLVTLTLVVSTNSSINQANAEPQLEACVPNETTAISIAEDSLLSKYGNKVMEYKPFRATLKDNKVWIVSGTKKESNKDVKVVGGVPYAEINKSDCKILRAYWTK